ncbi:MAG: ABC transporter permease [Desulfovibrionaceae bacterium]|nr:ABC transporter permease [Desulfovibrionaceae bacterium]MBF0512791.1 ABC transporter permease [Desulfovibrionaceae bacterium]
MNILTIPLRNLRRKWLKTCLLTGVFAAAVLSVVGLTYVSREVGQSLEKKLTQFGANILVEPKVESLSVGYGGFNLGAVAYAAKSLDASAAAAKIRSIALHERISSVAPKLIEMAKVGDKPVGLIGVDFEQEQLIKNYWTVTGAMPDKPGEVLAGSKAASLLGLAVGSTLTASGRDFTVAGVLDETGSEDDAVIFAGLRDVQEATGAIGQANFIEVAALCSACPIDDIVAQIRALLPDVEIVAMQKVVKSRMYAIDFVKNLAMGVCAVLLLTACFMIALSLLASVNERKHEIGILRSLGFSRAKVFAIFCFEAVAIGCAAAVAGYLGGVLASQKTLAMLDVAGQAEQAAHAGHASVVGFDAAHFGLTLAAVCLISVAASIAPAWKAANTDPCEALVML